MTTSRTDIRVRMGPVLKELVRLRADLLGITEAELMRRAVAAYIGVNEEKAKALAKEGSRKGPRPVTKPPSNPTPPRVKSPGQKVRLTAR